MTTKRRALAPTPEMIVRELIAENFGEIEALGKRGQSNAVFREYLDVIADASRIATIAQATIRSAVGAMRKEGASWERVGDALGISRQAAHKTYGP